MSSLLTLLSKKNRAPVGGSAPAGPWYLAGGVSAANCIAAYQAKGAASLAASLVNLVNPGTYNLTVADSTPGWSAALGWQFANLEYFATGMTAPVSVNRSIIAAYSGATLDGSPRFITGARNAGAGGDPSQFISLAPCNDPNLKILYGNGGQVYGALTNKTSGVMAVAGNAGYFNGNQDATLTANSGTGNWLPYYIGASNYNYIQGRFIGNISCVAYYSVTLTPTQVAAITTAMAAL